MEEDYNELSELNQQVIITENDFEFYLKEKLQNIIQSNQFCGICLESNKYLTSVDNEVEINTNSIKIKEIIRYIFRDEVHHFLSGGHICDECLRKTIETHKFITNTQQTLKLLDNYVKDLYFKSFEAINKLHSYSYHNTDVVIVLEKENQYKMTFIDDNSMKMEDTVVFVERRRKDDNTNTKTKKTEKVKGDEQKRNERNFNKKLMFECACKKSFDSLEILMAHIKTHSKVKCLICNQFVPDKDLIDHLKLFHKDNVHQCPICYLTYYSNEMLMIHLKISHGSRDEDALQQCKMCLKGFKGHDIDFHKCKYRCSECSENPCIHNKYLISFRDQIENGDSKIKCLDCDYICYGKEIYLSHVNREHLNHHPFCCDMCGQHYYSKSAVRAHIYRFHTPYIVCKYCDREFRKRTTYDKHVENCSSIQRSFKCRMCPASFDTLKNLTTHKIRRHTVNIFPCSLCNMTFLTDGKLKEHTAKVHRGLQIKTRRHTRICPICDIDFDTKTELQRHIKTHGENVKYPCKECNLEFATVRKLNQHNRKHYRRKVQCTVCSKWLTDVCLPNHMMLLHNSNNSEVSYVCEFCGEYVSPNTLLKNNTRIDQNSLACPKCSKPIPTSVYTKFLHNLNELITKRVNRLKYKRYKCNSCNYITSSALSLETHVNMHHLSKRPYICHICGKDFCGINMLDRHIARHSVNSDHFYCQICNKKFANSVCLRMHFRLHTGEKPYKCDVCNETFISASSLSIHKVKKHNERTVQCPICGSLHYLVRLMRQHFKSVHWPYKDRPFNHREVEGLSEDHYHLFEDGRKKVHK